MRSTALIAGALLSAWCGFTALAAVPGKAPGPGTPAAAPTRDPGPGTRDSRAIEFFEKEVRPVLAEQCYSCHGAKVQQGGLRLDSREGALKGGARGTSLVPGKPDKSLLIAAVRHDGALQMPPGRNLPEKQVAALEKWVRTGAPWPAGSTTAPATQSWPDIMKARKQWWSLLPVQKPPVPAVKDKRWSAQPVDRFILQALEKKGIRPSARADRRTLIRRVYLVLTGLPPAPEEVEAFVNDPSPKAYEKLVDTALASPHYGECWARHWMDVVRFCETHGYEWNHEIRDAWRYRDYLIRAFNQDVPYDQLIREHVAGDLLPNPRFNTEEQINESVVGTTFFRFGEVGHDVFREIGLDHLDNQIDTLSKAFQATTVGCARCHDHKLDAVSQRDYYALLGVVASSRQVVHTLDGPEVNRRQEERLRALKEQIRAELAPVWSAQARELGRYLLAARAAKEGRSDAAALAQGLDADRLKSLGEELGKTKTLEEPLYPWLQLAGAAAKSADVTAAWKALAERCRSENRDRAAYNAQHFQLWGDFSHGIPEGWRGEGFGIRTGPGPAGDFAVASDGDRALSGVFPAGIFTHSLSERMNGSIQSPYVPDKKFVSVEVMGGRDGAARWVPDFRLLQDGSSLKEDHLTWKSFHLNERDGRGYVELATKLDNIRYPGWGGGDKGEPFKDPRSFFGVTRAYLSDTGESPKDELKEILPLFSAEAASMQAAAERYAAVSAGALKRWASQSSTDQDARWIEWLRRTGYLANGTSATPRLGQLVTQYREAEKELQAPRVVAGDADLDGFDHPIYLRGDFHNVGEIARRRYLEAIASASDDMSVKGGSGRKGLAEEIASAGNPLTARVMVNRIWHYLFGAGLVRTPDDFGHMGEQPSHLELLDYLAARFMADGWSIKRMVRALVLTQTFQQSGQDSAKGAAADPENRLLHHYPVRRLDAEAIRDGILAVSGRLDGALYGPSIQPYRTEPMPERRLFPGPLDGSGRRSIYTKITLMQGPRFLEVFNFPDPKTSVGRRDVTNVPAQALTLMNDPFVTGQAEFWADRLVTQADVSVAARIDRMFRTALARPAQPPEVARFEGLVRELCSLEQAPDAEVLKSKAVWKDVAHAVFNLKEFIYVR